jgi:hypothetical protein
MEKQNKRLKNILRYIPFSAWLAILSIVLIGGLVFYLTLQFRKNEVHIEENKNIDITPTQIRSIESIGEWEFLTIHDEELIDTIKKGFFTDSQLTKIYYGTLRLGIDLQEAPHDWIVTKGDSIICTLPAIKLLDKNFIDEAKTKSFLEKGDWQDQDRELLYQKAYKKMLNRCMTPQNIKSAANNATQQFHQLLKSMGYEKIKIKIKSTK